MAQVENYFKGLNRKHYTALTHGTAMLLQVLSPRELLALPVVGDWLRQQQQQIPQARQGATEATQEAFVAPVIAPAVPQR
jgi:hypothetical protein